MMGQKCPSSTRPSSYSTTTSVPRVKEQTSVRMTSFTSAWRSFMAPSMAAPSATASSGLVEVSGNLRNSLIRNSFTMDSLVAPPTRTTLSISFKESPASLRERFTGSRILVNSSSQASSYALFVMTLFRSSSLYTKLKMTSDSSLKSHFAFSALR